MFKKLFSFFCDRSLLIFLIIGGLNTVISVIGSQLLLAPFTNIWGDKPAYWASTAIMFTLCSVFSFIFNRKYSFQSKAPLLQSAIRFSIVILVCYLISFGLSDILVPFIFTNLFHLQDATLLVRLAMLLAQVIFTGLNYIGQRLWAFKDN